MDSMTIPPPVNGAAYSAAEIAGIAAVEIQTVRNWASNGRLVAGKIVKLPTLTLPSGYVIRDNLCAFLSAVNKCKVRISE